MIDKEAQLNILERIIIFCYIRAWIEQVYVFEDDIE